MDELSKEIIRWLHEEFDEFRDLSALKITQLLRKSKDEVIPFIGVVGDYITEEEEIVCAVSSMDIWINIHIDFSSSNNYAHAYVKMKIENNLSIQLFESICQKLTLVIWNKYCSEQALEKKPERKESISSKSPSKHDIRKDEHLYEKRILTPSKEMKPIRKRKLSLSSVFLGKTCNNRSTSNKEISLKDQQINEIILEDDEHEGDFGYAQKLAQKSGTYQISQN